jgi:SAM-dependent methyltransferase|tara:strand:+ start:65 stop:709 length:645 start_codon:yes stop_codon:yes gene_type:complete
MIKRSRREHCLQIAEQNPDWKILDLGCGRDGIKLANVYADIENYSSDYQGFRFVQTEATKTPFEDKEFDFVFCNHIAEHVPDPSAFCDELVRISKRGFIEVPMPFFDNLVVGNSNPPPHGHVWWVTYDDVTNEVVFKPRKAIVEEMAIPADTTFLLPFFRESMILELYWEDSIDIRLDDPVFSYVAGNSDSPRVVDLTGKVIPSKVQKWRPKLL